MKILITGGAGFVGSRLAFAYRERHPGAEIVVLDNLKRRGSEINLPAFKSQNIRFVHGDIRSPSDIHATRSNFDLFIEASAEPSVHAGLDGDPSYLVQTNLMGTINCLEFARQRCGQFVFLSTSRVYSIEALRGLRLTEGESRLVLAPDAHAEGLSPQGIRETFSTATYRSLYGATKLASELLIQEYAATFGLNAVINRCGVIAGAGQFGKVDQGVFTLWVLHHYFSRPLAYFGFGGTGKQVRDLLHPLDLFDAIEAQRTQGLIRGAQIFNLGGGFEGSVSLRELTALCQEATGRAVSIEPKPETHAVDIPWYVTDTRRAEESFGWRPQRSVATIVREIAAWIRENEKLLEQTLLSS